MKNNFIQFVYPKGSMNQMVARLLSTMAVFADCPAGSASPSSILELELGSASIYDLDCFRSQDIPVLLERGAFDFGIVGRDWVAEREADIIEVEAFALSRDSFAPIRLVLAAPTELGYKSIIDLPLAATIATEYPVTTRKYLESSGRGDIQIQLSYGQTEKKVKVGAADAVVDLTETGNSLAANGLAIVEVVAESVMTLSANKLSYNDPNKGPAIRKFGEMIRDCYRLMLLDDRRGPKPKTWP